MYLSYTIYTDKTVVMAAMGILDQWELAKAPATGPGLPPVMVGLSPDTNLSWFGGSWVLLDSLQKPT